ncbi:hypothetical protein AVEN_71486-1 [Araneus ventricosus]|uniref:G domain-containing protein n=1 Tax=Araneus ventricosus TaxID=182803 RepID=A0A4Y2UEN1_ARAVE|nr:hypothetical protein AVEN_201666-1 [Araneus ventricosus]GBO10554.1 hypothetical protein AVEN_71486-1 [Araneus ventricosus]
MASSTTSRPGRGLNLPNSKDVSAQNADEEKGDQLMKSTFDLLERGEKEIILDNKHRDVILILGNTGSGKSTFTQWVAGDNTKMISKETEEGTGEYIIEDHNRIGNTTLKSKTIFPELVVDAKTNAAYYDFPGFSDTQGTSHDIATTYFIKKVVDYSESVKMVFTISHPSVRKGVDRQDFMKLMRHATDLVRDIKKFKKSIAIVATKVDNQYIKQDKNFILVEDDKVTAAIAHFLEEAKLYLEDNSKLPNVSKKENRFYENAIKFVEVLLEKEGEKYTRIGIFRRPDMPGPVSDIPLLQEGKRDIERIVYETLNFTARNNEDFGYTVSEETKNDINEIIEEINKNLWSSLSDIAGNIREYYRNLAEQVRDKINLFVSDANAVHVNFSEAEAFRNKFNSGYHMTSEVINKMNNLKNPEKLAVVINSTISNLDIDVSEDNILYIANQGKYFSFFQTVSDKVLSTKPWYQLFKDVETFLFSSETVILHDANSAAEKINNRIQIYLNDIVKGIQEEYAEKIKSLEIQNLPDKLNRDIRVIFKFTEEIKNGTTIGKLVRAIPYVVDDLGVSLPKQNLQIVANQGKYLRFLEVIGDGTLNVDTMMWLSPFESIAKYFYESEKWYTFLEDLYNKFSEYDIQKDRQRYNVANLNDWYLPGRPQGISVTPNTFEKFLNKIGNFNVTEYETIRNLTTKTDLQIEELNQILSITLKHRPNVMCSEPYVIVKGSFISLNETMQNIIDNSDTNNSCKNFEALLAGGKYKLFKFLGLNKVFIDTDLSLSGKEISVAVIAPKWEVVGSRSIDLSGADGAPQADIKARNGAHPGNNGVNGAAGNPGASGENFFGIGATFAGGANLKITSNGGKGSRGQDGGDGAQGVPGRNARTPSKNDPDCENGYFRDFKCLKLKEDRINFGYVETKKTYKIYGVPGGKGGNGGDGGKGGKGADSGNIAILELSQPSEITKLSSMGKEGEIGKAGAGGKGGKDGDDIIAVYTYAVLTRCFRNCLRTEWNLKETSSNGIRPAGSKGTDGENAVGLQDPVPSNGINRPSNIINEYKIFLRGNINNRFEKYPLLQFLDQLNNRNDVRNFYDTLALIDEFQGLEEQFHKLSNQMDFNHFYSSLLERVSELAKSQKDAADSDESKKVLNYLYTATLGRLYNLKGNSESNLIIDIRGYLNLIKENIITLKDLQMTNSKLDVINKYKENYKKGIDKKIEEAKSLIKKQINPEIENINSKIDDEVDTLIEETITLQKQAEKDYEKLAEKKKELENSVATKGLFSFFHIIGGIVSFLGPIGAIAGTVIEAASTVAESLALNNQQQALNLPSDVVSAIATIGGQIKAMRNKKVAYLNKLLDDLSEEIKKNPEKLSDMTGKIDDIKDKLKKASEKKMDFKQVKALESELKGELKRKGDDLKIDLDDKKTVDALKVIKQITQIAQFGSLLLNMNGRTKEDNEKMDAVTDAMKKIKDKIKKLKEYEENISDAIEPMLQEMEDHMKDISDKLGSKSQVALDVTKWQVQSTLKDMRLQMERLTEGFEVKDDLSRSIEKLEEVMTTLIKIYDRIENYQDQQNLANYIADISSVAASSINIKNQQLINSVNHLEFSIRANVVLKQYKSAIDAFKQWVFPFADHYIEKSMLPSQIELETNIEDLVQNAARQIEAIKQKIDLYDASVKNGDEYLQCEEFSSRYVSSQPFFVWKNEDFGSLISNLLSGKQVVLKADVKDSVPHKDAIKFREIDFDFKLKNETAQPLLYETLKAFDIRATHLGSSYYRYENKIFLITSDSVTISYSYEKNNDGTPIRSNEVYNKLKSGDLLLSPYTLWEVRMINQTNQYSFQDLENYKSEINVELSGFGSYVDTNVFRPTTHKSYIVYNNTNPLPLEYNVTGLNQSRRSEYRLLRSPEEIVVDGDYMTNGAPKGMSSTIGFLSTFLQSYFITNIIRSLNQIIDGEQISIRNYDDCSKLSYERSETRNTGPIVESNPTITDTQKIVTTSAEDHRNKERIGPKSDTIFNLNFDGNNSCSKSFLLSDQKDRSTYHSTQATDLNCSLLLADMITRTITGNRYKSPIDECLLSPTEVILGNIRDEVLRSESDIKQMLQRHLSEKEEISNSMFSKLKGYANSMFQFLGLVGNDDTEKYVEDVRNLFA